MKSIALVIPYFGKFNNYFNLWLRSCANNPSITWLIFTDIDPEKYSGFVPPNVVFINTTFGEVKKRIQSLFDFEISLDSPYKFCDFRPAYGEIFQKELQAFDFWGHCDCDMIFGNIRNFVTDEILDKYDRIYSRGHLSIYRNSPHVNSFYRLENNIGVSYKKVLQSGKSYSFDEWGGVSRLWDAYAKDKFYDKIDFDDISVKYKHFESYQKVFQKFDGEPKKWVYFSFSKDGLTRVSKNDKTQTCYVHFQKRNMQVSKDIFPECKEFIMVPNKFLPKDAIKNKISQFLLCRKRIIYPQFLKLKFKNLLKRLRSKH
ncbi:MAG: hypothetical protein IKS15_02370 [Opitutales bacterium]|nr:hypothetical protein [Opitutales bacterium]